MEESVSASVMSRQISKNIPKKNALCGIFPTGQALRMVVAVEHLSGDEVLDKLNHAAYFALLERPVPESINAILYELEQDRLIAPCAAGGWNVTNLGAILFAKRIGDFRRLERKSIRVIQYQGTGRTESVGERQSSWGYAAGFANLLKYINGRIYRENIDQKWQCGNW